MTAASGGEYAKALGEALVMRYSLDEEADTLYLWRGDEPQEAISFETTCIVRRDPETGDLVGVTVFDVLMSK